MPAPIKTHTTIALTALASVLLAVPLTFSFISARNAAPKAESAAPVAWEPQKAEELQTVQHDGHWFLILQKRGYNHSQAFMHHPECPKCKPAPTPPAPVELTLPELPPEPPEGPNIFTTEPPKRKKK